MVLRGVTVVRDGEEIPPAQIPSVSTAKQEAKAAQVRLKRGRKQARILASNMV